MIAQGCILDDERAKLYATVVKKGSAARFAFAAAIFGETSEALFWLQLPHALKYMMDKLVNKSIQKAPVSASIPELDDTTMLSRISSMGKSVTEKKNTLVSPFNIPHKFLLLVFIQIRNIVIDGLL